MNTPLYRLLGFTAWVASVGVAWGSYDEYMTCGSGHERYGRQYHHHPELPCDITKNSWCENAGTQYPWGAVRKFVYENQGLMKRMYGNQRHYNVLRAEVLNELYEDMFDEMPKRQHHYLRQQSASARSARYQKPSSANTLRTNDGKPGSSQQRSTHNSGSKQDATQSQGSKQRTDSRAMKVSIGPEYSGVRRHHEHTRPKVQSKAPKIRRKTTTQRGRPTTTTTTSTTTQHGSQNTHTAIPTTTNEGAVATTTEDLPTTEGEWYDTDFDTEETQIRDYTPLVEADTQPPVLPFHTFQDEDDEWTTLSDSPHTSSSSYSTPYSSYDTESSYASMTVPETSTTALPTSRTDVLDELLDDEGYISTPLDDGDLTTLTLTADDYEQNGGQGMNVRDGGGIWDGGDDEGVRVEEQYDDINDGTVLESEKLTVQNREQVGDGIQVDVGGVQPAETRQQVDGVRVDDLRVEGNVREEAKTEAPPNTMPNIQRPVRGMNACPVKEEFVAPYWANNTRGQTLALLNLYPFEQYVQWERCQYEHRQMYCRAGCRCEQQYRLHKLLAFDPSNECRGIFSDWFRFPSCCVCKCYDLPMEVFTASSRRPRFNTEDEEEDYDYADEEETDEYFPPPPRRPTYVNIPPQRRPRLPPRPYSHISPPSYNLQPPSPLDQNEDDQSDQKFSNPQEGSSQPHFSHNQSETSSQNQKPSNAQVTGGVGSSNSQHNESTQRPELATLGTLDVATPHYYFNLTNYARVLLAKGPASTLTRLPRSPEE